SRVVNSIGVVSGGVDCRCSASHLTSSPSPPLHRWHRSPSRPQHRRHLAIAHQPHTLHCDLRVRHHWHHHCLCLPCHEYQISQSKVSHLDLCLFRTCSPSLLATQSKQTHHGHY